VVGQSGAGGLRGVLLNRIHTIVCSSHVVKWADAARPTNRTRGQTKMGVKKATSTLELRGIREVVDGNEKNANFETLTEIMDQVNDLLQSIIGGKST
jgi:hypothetical protein